MNIDETTRLRPSPHALARAFDAELVVLDLAKGEYFGLDEIGSKLWSGLVAGRSVAEIVDVIGAEYDVDRPTLAKDLLELTKELLDRGLVVEAP